MNKNILLLKFLFLFFIIIIVFYLANKYYLKKNMINYENFENINVNIGNYLVVYFYLMGKSFLRGNDFNYNLKDVKFIKDLPSFVPLNKDIENQFIEYNFTLDELYNEEKKIILVAMWTIINERREQFWLIMKPQINQILDEALIKNNLNTNIDYPVIHFRCSDTPFIRNGFYFFQKYKFFKDSLEEIKKMKNINYDKVILLSCNSHKSNDKNSDSCNIYANSLQDYLENLGYEVIIKCESNLEDFATMFYAPAVISTCSSFSFIAGFFSNGIFISEGHYDCNNDKIKCDSCDNWLKNGYSIPHNEIDDYYNTDLVIQKLYD